MTKRMPPHPGRYISDEMAHLNISLRTLARALDVSPSTIGRVVEGRAAVTPAMAVRLANVIGQYAGNVAEASRGIQFGASQTGNRFNAFNAIVYTCTAFTSSVTLDNAIPPAFK
ncbi:HigA family addiction module antitoxin [Xenorhabdus eapokensis]|uniref:Virulence-associated protein n=1 Tax=Xenorhabdus eapokensis TaxID=1873482 RepID=A0A1Q5TWJ6_9GAMM|nr:virulence-associated protein [Xenorhabdus eapokensis]